MSSITRFTSSIKYGLARTSKFRVKITNPVNPSADIDVPFLCFSASLPGLSNPAKEVAYMGRKIKVAGAAKEYEDWSVKIYNDEDFKVRNALEHWMNMINANEGNVNQFQSSEIINYKSLGEVDQLSQTDQVLCSYKFVGIFPTKIDALELDWGDDNTQSFGVTFAVDYTYKSFASTGQYATDDLTIDTLS